METQLARLDEQLSRLRELIELKTEHIDDIMSHHSLTHDREHELTDLAVRKAEKNHEDSIRALSAVVDVNTNRLTEKADRREMEGWYRNIEKRMDKVESDFRAKDAAQAKGEKNIELWVAIVFLIGAALIGALMDILMK
jgi:hypothetical protein